MRIRLINITREAEKTIVFASQVCKNKADYEFSEGIVDGTLNDEVIKKYILARIKEGHFGVLEHAVATFRWSDISRALTHQLVRHRIASYCQQSQRAVSPKASDIVTPPSIETWQDVNYKGASAQVLYERAASECFRTYERLLGLGIPKEDARFILPEATFTDIIITKNFRTWRHSIRLRSSKRAQWEIREATIRSLEILQQEAPNVFGDFIITAKGASGTSIEIPENCE